MIIKNTKMRLIKEYRFQEGLRIRDVRSVSVRKRGLNQKVERLNGVFRDREKVMRGLHTRNSSQKTIDAFRVHYNFVRNHGSIKQTPAEKAGIMLNLQENKIKNLMKIASSKKGN